MIAIFFAIALLLGAGVLFSRGRLALASLAAGLLMAFTGLAVGVHTRGWVTGLDASVASWFGTQRSYGWDVPALVIAAVGGPAPTALTGLIGGALLSWRARSMIPGFVVIAMVGAAALAKTAIKAVVETPRSATNPPSPHVVETGHHPLATEHHRWASLHHWLEILNDRLETLNLLPTELNSFPSGHVTGTAVLLGMIAVCVGAGLSPTARAWLAGLVIAAVLAVAVSRLYLGAHSLTDVIGGALLGGVFVTLGAFVLGVLQSRFGQETTKQKMPVTDPPMKVH